jgi:hypothetical protein
MVVPVIFLLTNTHTTELSLCLPLSASRVRIGCGYVCICPLRLSGMGRYVPSEGILVHEALTWGLLVTLLVYEALSS